MLANLSLSRKLALFTLLGLLVGVGVFSFLSTRAVNRATDNMLEDRLTTAKLVADFLDDVLGRALVQLSATARDLSPVDSQGTRDIRLRQLSDFYSRMSLYVHGFYLLDQNGEVVWSEPDVAGRGVNLATYPGVDRAVQGKPGISGLVSVPSTGSPVVLIAAPTIPDENGARGTLVAAINLANSNIGGFIRPIRLGKTGYVEIVDQNGVVVTRTEPGPELDAFEKSDHSGRFAALIEAGKPTRGVCHTCHEAGKTENKDVLAFVPLAQARWGVVIRQSEKEALAPISQLNQNLVLFGVGLVMTGLGFVGLVMRDVGRRIGLLTTASQRIAGGDLASPVALSGRDEIGLLASKFDDMRLKLKTSYDRLEQRTRELAALLSISQILSSTAELPQLLAAVVARAVAITAGATGGVLLMDKDGELKVQCAAGSGEPVDIHHLIESKPASAMCADVLRAGTPIGRLYIFGDSPDVFNDDSRRLLSVIADYIAIALERAELAKSAAEVRTMQELDRLRSEFISSVSHELRNPLTLIKGYSTSLLRQDTAWDEPSRREFLEIIDQKSDELRELIDKLLQSARLEAGSLKVQKEPVLLPKLAEKIIEEFRQRAGRHSLSTSFVKNFPVIEADLSCMRQVLSNLVENAVKYSPAGGNIIVAGKVLDGRAVISVSDEGIGIPPAAAGHIFERFYRVAGAQVPATGGSGLGLYIVKGHVEAHGGEVWLESTPGKGSVFYFSLPLNGDDIRTEATGGE